MKQKMHELNALALVFIHTPLGVILYTLSVWLFYAFVREVILDADVAFAADNTNVYLGPKKRSFLLDEVFQAEVKGSKETVPETPHKKTDKKFV